jgi:hypothetical protein
MYEGMEGGLVITKELLEERYLDDGLYAISDGAEVLELPDDAADSFYRGESNKYFPLISEFADKYPNFVVASAYETFNVILISEPPTRIKSQVIGHGFNYGVNAVIEDCPKRLLILAF